MFLRKLFHQISPGFVAPLRLLAFHPVSRPRGNLHLRLALDQRLSYGRCGVAYSVNVCASQSSQEVLALSIPPLVAKISRPGRNEDLEHEVYNYDELESLQGIVVPRCYGLFSGTVPKGSSLIPEVDDEITDSKPFDQNGSREPKRITGAISILLVERLGEHLPVGEPLPGRIM